jgi:hypothetical protein
MPSDSQGNFNIMPTEKAAAFLSKFIRRVAASCGPFLLQTSFLTKVFFIYL